MELNSRIAEMELEKAGKTNPGPWTDHCRYAAMACRNIAAHCEGMSADEAYILGLLHDIGRYEGVYAAKHLIKGYRYCMERGWEKPAQICITHEFMIQDIRKAGGPMDVSEEDSWFIEEFLQNVRYDDYDCLVQLCDALALPTGFCILEKRFVDVALRYGIYPATLERWKKVLEIKEMFEKKTGCSIYDLLPGVAENSLR